MALTGHKKDCAKRNGGIKTIALIDQSLITGTSFNSLTNDLTGITIKDDGLFKKYEFREDQASYKETVAVTNGSTTVAHEIKFYLERMGNTASKSISEILDITNSGIVALVITNNGDSFVVGYSEKFEFERPLRVLNVEGSTGSALGDTTGETITLRSEDTSKAVTFSGLIDEIIAN